MSDFGGGDKHGFVDGPVLSIDTSTASMTLAVTDGERVLGERLSHSERNHSVRLMPEMDELLRSVGMRPRDLRAIAVGCGPGSYTGARIGVAAAKTLAWSLGVPLYSVSSLEALCVGGWRSAVGEAAVSPAWIVPVLDARRGQAYTAVYAVDESGSWSCVRPDAIEMFRPYAESVIGAPDRPSTVVFVGGDEWGRLESEASALLDTAGVDALRVTSAMAARDIASVARRRGAAVLVSDVHGLAPNYAQLAEAEVKLLAQTPE